MRRQPEVIIATEIDQRFVINNYLDGFRSLNCVSCTISVCLCGDQKNTATLSGAELAELGGQAKPMKQSLVLLKLRVVRRQQFLAIENRVCPGEETQCLQLVTH